MHRSKRVRKSATEKQEGALRNGHGAHSHHSRACITGMLLTACHPTQVTFLGAGHQKKLPTRRSLQTEAAGLLAERANPSSPPCSPPWGRGLPSPGFAASWWGPHRPLQAGGQCAAGSGPSGAQSSCPSFQSHFRAPGKGSGGEGHRKAGLESTSSSPLGLSPGSAAAWTCTVAQVPLRPHLGSGANTASHTED